MNLGEEPIAGKDRHPLLEQLKEAYSEKDGAHDLAHIERVLRHAQRINQALIDNGKEEANWRVIEAALILHEITKDDPNVVRTYLVGHGYVEDEVVAVIDCIKRHYDYTEEGKPTTIEGQVVQDADIMDMLGPIGVARAFLSAGARG